jgi:hypothetical protein
MAGTNSDREHWTRGRRIGWLGHVPRITSRESLFGQTLEQVDADASGCIARMRDALLPMRMPLRQNPYFGDEHPNCADCIDLCRGRFDVSPWGC